MAGAVFRRPSPKGVNFGVSLTVVGMWYLGEEGEQDEAPG
jgi:hypothetical protein